MARYRGTVQGQRGGASRLGGTVSGLAVTANGWDVGARVDVGPCGACLEYCVIVLWTSGSNGHASSRTIDRYHATGKACHDRPNLAEWPASLTPDDPAFNR